MGTDTETESKDDEQTSSPVFQMNMVFNPIMVKILKRMAKFGCDKVQTVKFVGVDAVIEDKEKSIENADLFKEYLPKFQELKWKLRTYVINEVITLSIDFDTPQ